MEKDNRIEENDENTSSDEQNNNNTIFEEQEQGSMIIENKDADHTENEINFITENIENFIQYDQIDEAMFEVDYIVEDDESSIPLVVKNKDYQAFEQEVFFF